MPERASLEPQASGAPSHGKADAAPSYVKDLKMFAHSEMHVASESVDAQALLHRVALIPDENVKAGELARPLGR